MSSAEHGIRGLCLLGLAASQACLANDSSVLPDALRAMTTIVAVDAEGRNAVAFETNATGYVAEPFEGALYLIGYPYPALQLQIPIGALPVPVAARPLPLEKRSSFVRKDGSAWEPASELPVLQPMLAPFDTDLCLGSGGCLRQIGLAERCSPCETAPQVLPPDPPELPCPAGWVPDPMLSARGLPGCVWEVVDRCDVGQPFVDGCQEVIPPCSATGAWPRVPPGPSVVYLSSTASSTPDNSAPARTFEEAVSRLRGASSATIAVGEGTHSGSFNTFIDYPLTLRGVCAQRSRIIVSGALPHIYVHGPWINIQDLSLETTIVFEAGVASITRASLSAAGVEVVGVTGPTRLYARQVEVSGAGTGFQGIPGTRMVLERVTASGFNFAGVASHGGELVLRDSMFHDGDSRAVYGAAHASLQIDRVLIEDTTEGIALYDATGEVRDVVIRNGRSGESAGAIVVAGSTISVERVAVKHMGRAGVRLENGVSGGLPMAQITDMRVEDLFLIPSDENTHGILRVTNDGLELPERIALRAERVVMIEAGNAVNIFSGDGIEVRDALLISKRGEFNPIDMNGRGHWIFDRVYAEGDAGRYCVFLNRANDHATVQVSNVRTVGCNEGIVIGADRFDFAADRLAIADATGAGLRVFGPLEPTAPGLVSTTNVHIDGAASVGIVFNRAHHVLEHFVVDGPVTGLSLNQLESTQLESVTASVGHVRATSVGVRAHTRDPLELRHVLDQVRVESAGQHLLVE